MKNPFYINGTIPEEYFCDRKNETDTLVRHIQNKSNVLLTSPRRMGKTQLIRHLYAQPIISETYYTFYIDIYPTTSLAEFVLLLGKEVYGTLAPKGRKVLDLFIGALKSLYGSFGYDALTGLPTFNVMLGDIVRPETTLEELFRFLEEADRPCILAIDEFQQTGRYPQKNVEALLRTYIQKMGNCSFIFAGSERHSLENMFNSPARPFYNSAGYMHLDRIERHTYVDFIIDKFRECGRTVPEDICGFVYDLFEGHTYYIHQTMHDVFARQNEVTRELVLDAIEQILSDREHYYMNQMSFLSLAQKEVLIAVAKDGEVSAPTSAAFIRKHALQSASSVQNAMKTLLEDQILTYSQKDGKKTYSIADRFFRLWINQVY
ncbi:MAG: ATP-binding protein [Candidatus Cryptobacteroides sp.]